MVRFLFKTIRTRISVSAIKIRILIVVSCSPFRVSSIISSIRREALRLVLQVHLRLPDLLLFVLLSSSGYLFWDLFTLFIVSSLSRLDMDFLSLDKVVRSIQDCFEPFLGTEDDEPETSCFSGESIFDDITFLNKAKTSEIFFKFVVGEVLGEATNKYFSSLLGVSFCPSLFSVECWFHVDLDKNRNTAEFLMECSDARMALAPASSST